MLPSKVADKVKLGPGKDRSWGTKNKSTLKGTKKAVRGPRIFGGRDASRNIKYLGRCRSRAPGTLGEHGNLVSTGGGFEKS